ncbi:unnamed protein product [Prunus armeniaca]
MTGPLSFSNPSQAPSPAAVVLPEKVVKGPVFRSIFIGFVFRRPAAIFGDPCLFWDRDSGQIWSVFGRWVIALDTHALSARGHCRKRALCPDVISWSLRVRRCALISIWIPFESRTDIAYFDSWMEGGFGATGKA